MDLFLLGVGLIFGISLAVALIYQVAIFILSLVLKRNDIADVAWGFGFVLITYFWFFISPVQTLGYKVVLFCVSLWGLRLTFHIGTRFLKKTEEDFRYAVWRKEWKHFKLRSFFQVYMLQGLLMTVILMPVILHASVYESMTELVIIGFIMWLTGFILEATADVQLSHFVATNTDKKALMTKGVWAICRHPNYLGEILVWWGIFIMTIGYIHPLYMGVAAIGPIVITLLLRFVSGVPMLEKAWADKYPEAFAEYKKTTPMLFPMFPIWVIKK